MTIVMNLFLISGLIAAGATLIMLVFLALWTYHDAKVKSEQSPILWAAVAVFISNFLGIIIYLLIGRTKKDVPAPGKFKIPLIASIVLFIISFVFMGIVGIFSIFDIGIGEGNMAVANRSGGFMQDIFGNMNSGSFRNLRTSRGNANWQITVGSGNGFIQISPQLTLSEIENLSVSGSANGGVILQLEQDNIGYTIILPTNVDDGTMVVDNLDTADFVAGRVRMRMYFEQAENVDLLVSWDDR
ncbi:MAG: hypothetical protein FWG64_04585 [Firmicutes bacterium]|nr:hypothetical protein [Bacillota bacterium]